LRDAGLVPGSIAAEPPSMEDVFIERMTEAA
jgi:hypothetical protein